MIAEPSPPPPRIGVLGGTFDPVHLGHLHAAERVRRVLSLPSVLLVPCATPPHKSRPDLTPAAHRLAMLRAAASGTEGLEVSDLEIVRGGVSYTFETLRILASGPTPARPLLIVGLDALREIGTWFRHADLLREFGLIAVDRPPDEEGAAPLGPGDLPADVAARIVPFAPAAGAGGVVVRDAGPPPGRIYLVRIGPLPISSSRVRALAAAGQPLAGLVPDAVARYIQERGLYRKEARR